MITSEHNIQIGLGEVGHHGCEVDFLPMKVPFCSRSSKQGIFETKQVKSKTGSTVIFKIHLTFKL